MTACGGNGGGGGAAYATLRTAMLRACIAGAAAMWGAGCSPMVRYSSDAQGSGMPRYVARNWDYRETYKLPPQRLLKIIESYIGTPYRRGGMSRRGADCSGFVNLVFGELNHARLPRSSAKMFKLGTPVAKGALRTGDLVFFKGGVFGAVNHVGISTGEGRFAHASAKKGVMYSALDEEYFKQRYAGARRLFK
jgi:cell wall-associated NlpC family hydrolase